MTIHDEKHFWTDQESLVGRQVHLPDFRISDWFPRTPGVYWSDWAHRAREVVWNDEMIRDPDLGRFYRPESKISLIEEGGIGTLRLRPRVIDGEMCLLGTALSGHECHTGISLVLPQRILRSTDFTWGDHVSIRGEVKFFQEVGLDDLARSVHHSRPLAIVVDELTALRSGKNSAPIIISPVALFEDKDRRPRLGDTTLRYTFVQCEAGCDGELDRAADWIEHYAKKFAGRVITNFDETRPVLADAPLSYQRLAKLTYDERLFSHLGPGIHIAEFHSYIQNMKIGNHIQVGGSAVINIDSTLTNVTQTIGHAPGLDTVQRQQLDGLVAQLTVALTKAKASHPEECREIASALEKAIVHASKPVDERKPNFLQLSAKGLRDAAELLKDIAPDVIATATAVAKFITGIN